MYFLLVNMLGNEIKRLSLGRFRSRTTIAPQCLASHSALANILKYHFQRTQVVTVSDPYVYWYTATPICTGTRLMLAPNTYYLGMLHL